MVPKPRNKGLIVNDCDYSVSWKTILEAPQTAKYVIDVRVPVRPIYCANSLNSAQLGSFKKIQTDRTRLENFTQYLDLSAYSEEYKMSPGDCYP